MGGIILIGLLSFGAVFLGVMAVAAPRRQLMRKRLGLDKPSSIASERRLEGGFLARNVAPFMKRAGGRVASLLPHNIIHGVERMLMMANDPWSLHGFLAAWLGAAIGAIVFTVWLTASSNMSPLQVLTLGGLFIMLCVTLPYATLRRRVRARQKAITHGLPDALDLLVTCVEAGIGVDAAFVMVTEKTEGPIAETFTLYLRQVGLGRARRDALAYVAERTGVQDLMVLAASVSQGEELGTSLSDVLRTQAEGLRVARRQRAEAAAQRAPVLMTIPLVLCFMPAMAAVVVVPSVLNLLNFIDG
ncbi:MAG TPA: type II secretion system F family protein [Tepidiformaceae bacterium]